MPTIRFIDADNRTLAEVDAPEGSTILDIAQGCGLDIEGACEGSMACSTCHVILAPEYHALVPEASEEEADMLDLTAGIMPTSRLGCQIEVSAALDGMVVQLPRETRNMLGL